MPLPREVSRPRPAGPQHSSLPRPPPRSRTSAWHLSRDRLGPWTPGSPHSDDDRRPRAPSPRERDRFGPGAEHLPCGDPIAADGDLPRSSGRRGRRTSQLDRNRAFEAGARPARRRARHAACGGLCRAPRVLRLFGSGDASTRCRVSAQAPRNVAGGRLPLPPPRDDRAGGCGRAHHRSSGLHRALAGDRNQTASPRVRALDAKTLGPCSGALSSRSRPARRLGRDEHGPASASAASDRSDGDNSDGAAPATTSSTPSGSAPAATSRPDGDRPFASPTSGRPSETPGHTTGSTSGHDTGSPT